MTTYFAMSTFTASCGFSSNSSTTLRLLNVPCCVQRRDDVRRMNNKTVVGLQQAKRRVTLDQKKNTQAHLTSPGDRTGGNLVTTVFKQLALLALGTLTLTW